MSSRPISIEGFAPPPSPPESGAAPLLQWLPVESLVVDEAYQRPIVGGGRRNVLRIAHNFRWSRFAPVIVSPIEGGFFAIVDGQHRTTAALLAGIKTVPCQVIIANPVEQAEAFAAINGNVTRVGKLALFRAAAASGDTAAIAVEKAARRARVKILPYPKGELLQEPGETMAIGALESCLRLYGETILVLALRCIVETRNNVKGGVLASIIQANCHVLNELPRAVTANEAAVIAAFDRINLIREMSKARDSDRAPGTNVWRVLSARISEHLAKVLLAKVSA